MRATTFERSTPVEVSFILTTKNRAHLLDDALRKAREYVRPEDEVIVVDGGSTDETARVIERYADLVDLFVSEPDRSAGHAFNKGMLLARGRFIRQISDDDVLHPEGLRQALAVFDANPELDLMVCGGTKETNGRIDTVYLPPGTSYGTSLRDPFQFSGSGVGFIIRRRGLALMGLHPTGPASDLEFVLQAIREGAMVRFCRVNLFHHHVHHDSYTRRLARECDAHYVRMAREYGSRTMVYRWQLAGLARRAPMFGFLSWPDRVSRVLSRGGLPGLLRKAAASVGIGSATADAEQEYLWDGGFS